MFNSADRYQKNFNSITEYAQYIASLKPAQGALTSSLSTSGGHEWDYGMHFADTLSNARQGGCWQEGASKLQQAIADAPHKIAMVASESMENSMVGACVDMGAYFEGDPECMFTTDIIEHAKPVVRILVNGTASSNTEASQYVNRGRAIVALVESIQSQGYAVEITLAYCSRCQHSDQPDKKNGIETHIIVKQAHEPLSLEQLAFMVAHPAPFRRLHFREIEAYSSEQTYSCYGYPTKAHNADEFDVYFDCMNGKGYNSPQQALQQALDILDTFNKKRS